MTGTTGYGSENGARSGAPTLVLLAAPLTSFILRTLADGPQQHAELRHRARSPAQTTLRAQLKRLEGVGAITKRRRNGFPGVLEYELNAAGRDLLQLADATERWLRRAPEGPLSLGGETAKAAIKALAEGWSTTMLRAIGAGALSLTQLDRAIDSLSYPSLERRLAALRLAGLVEAIPGNGRGTPYVLTDWACEGIGPIAGAARWERRHAPRQAAPFGRMEAEAFFLLLAPLLSGAEGESGSCRMAMEISGNGDRRLAGVVAEIENGRVRSYTPRLQGDCDAWALGSATAWFDAAVAADYGHIECGGDGRLTRALLASVHDALNAGEVRSA